MAKRKRQGQSPTDAGFAGIEKRLDMLVRLMAANVGGGLSVKDRAHLLDRAGVDRATIAAVCNTTPEVISVRLAEARRKKRKK